METVDVAAAGCAAGRPCAWRQHDPGGAECEVSGHQIHVAISRSVMAVHDSGHLSHQHHSGALTSPSRGSESPARPH